MQLFPSCPYSQSVPEHPDTPSPPSAVSINPLGQDCTASNTHYPSYGNPDRYLHQKTLHLFKSELLLLAQQHSKRSGVWAIGFHSQMCTLIDYNVVQAVGTFREVSHRQNSKSSSGHKESSLALSVPMGPIFVYRQVG